MGRKDQARKHRYEQSGVEKRILKKNSGHRKGLALVSSQRGTSWRGGKG